MTAGFPQVEQWVRAELAAARQIGLVDVTDVVAHPTREVVACTVHVRTALDADPTSRVALVDIDTHRCTVLDLGSVEARAAHWAPDGERLAVLVTNQENPPTVWIVDLPEAAEQPLEITRRLPAVSGAVEDLAWSPDGGRIGLVIAQFGAEVSDVHGSGTVAGPSAQETWRPAVSPAPDQGRRILHVWTPDDGTVTPIPTDLNVWEAAWCGPDRFVVVATSGVGEGAWYAAALRLLGMDGQDSPLLEVDVQMAAPRATSSGERWSVIVGRASDRGLLAGDLVVGGTDLTTQRWPAVDVDVTAQGWLDDRRISFAGTRRTASVFGVLDVVLGRVDELFATDGATGLHQPDLGATTAGGRLVAVLERHDQPPTMTAVSGSSTIEVLSTAGSGTNHLARNTGTTTATSWRSTDGTLIEGLLTVPWGDGPHALVVDVHGGPVATWRDGWIGKYPYTATLVARGFAVLRPNPRGSAGRGQDFIEKIVGDMGGDDVDDVVTGVAAMIDAGVTEPGRVGITGNSYGGYLAAWIPCWSDVFAAAVSRSPVVDWPSQHLTGNLAAFDELFVGGDPFDPESPYTTRSPLTYHRQVSTPILFTAGALDLATPASQAQQMHHALLATGVPTELAIYPEEGHGVRGPDAMADQLARMIWWFERHLTPA